MPLPYTLSAPTSPDLGLIVLQADETIEPEFRHRFPADTNLYTTRVPSAQTLTSDSLHAMADDLTAAADLFPSDLSFHVIAYACTSGACHIGPARVADLIRAARPAKHITDPLTALRAACEHQHIKRLGLLTPYTTDVAAPLIAQLAQSGITTPAIGSFDEPVEANVVRIDTASIIAAGQSIAAQTDIDALFLSCTNLRTRNAIPALETALNIPVLSSNSALAWHINQLTQPHP